MVHILAKQKVKNFYEWKIGFLEHDDARKAAGSSNGVVFVNPNVGHNLVLNI